MSKLAGIRAYQNSGYYAGDVKSFFKKLIAKGKGLFKKGKGLVKQLVPEGGVESIIQQLTGGPSSPAFPDETGAGGTRGRRRARGITARELRGYRKVANLLHKEGMVSRRSRGRK